jgi:peptide/nickel transport system substrate-binding protein
MQKRDFNKFLMAAGAMGLLDLNLGITLAHGQTRGGTLNSIVQPEPPILNLAISQLTPTQMVAGKIFLSLLTYDTNLKPLPSLAKSWTISPDGKTYTFNLERNVKWHDGKPLTADDVLYTVKEFLPLTHPRAKALFGRCESITAPDPYTVVFKLQQPFAPFIGAFDISNLPVMPKHVYAGTDVTKNPANDTPIGTGPFKLKEWRRGSHIHLVANADYYIKGQPALTEIFYKIIPDGASRSVAMESGQAQLSQFADIEPFDVPRLAAMPQLKLTTKGYEFFSPVIWYEMNNCAASRSTTSVSARRCGSCSIPNSSSSGSISGSASPPPGRSPRRPSFYDPNVTIYKTDVAAAKALLDEMGLKPDASGVRARIRFLVVPFGEFWTRLGEYFRQALKQGGIEVTLDTTDAGGFAEKVSNWDYETTCPICSTRTATRRWAWPAATSAPTSARA